MLIYSQSQPEYLFDTEQKRGKFEKSFTAIGSSVCVGSAIGGTYGLFNGNFVTYLLIN